MFDYTSLGIADWVSHLADLPRDVSDADRVTRLRMLEEVACAVAAAQARDAVDLDASRRAERAAAGVPLARQGEGVAAEVGLARRTSPHRGARLLGLAKILHAEMPHTLALMTAGRLTEWRATLLARETGCLERADRATVDEQLCGGGDPPAATLGDAGLVAAARRIAARLDARAVAARAAKAVADRHVSLRPAPDTMTHLGALLPVGDGVAVLAALRAAADTARSAGDPRSRGQVMADTLVARVTGRDPLEQPVDLDLHVVLTDRTLLTGDNTPAEVPDHGPVPAPWIRRVIRDAITDPATQVWVRQLYTGPHGGLTATASRSRLAPAGLAELIALRDQTCRTPWCDAPIRHTDHITAWSDGGTTTADNLQGLCEACNYARQAHGWHAVQPVAGSPGDSGPPCGRHCYEVVTPTAHRYRSTAPPLPGEPVDDRPELTVASPYERRLELLLAA